MTIDERQRHGLHERLDEVLGRPYADTLMSLLPPVGWADVATKSDLDHLQQVLDLRLDTEIAAVRTEIAELRTEMWVGLAELGLSCTRPSASTSG